MMKLLGQEEHLDGEPNQERKRVYNADNEEERSIWMVNLTRRGRGFTMQIMRKRGEFVW